MNTPDWYKLLQDNPDAVQAEILANLAATGYNPAYDNMQVQQFNSQNMQNNLSQLSLNQPSNPSLHGSGGLQYPSSLSFSNGGTHIPNLAGAGQVSQLIGTSQLQTNINQPQAASYQTLSFPPMQKQTTQLSNTTSSNTSINANLLFQTISSAASQLVKDFPDTYNQMVQFNANLTSKQNMLNMLHQNGQVSTKEYYLNTALLVQDHVLGGKKVPRFRYLKG